MGAKSAFVLPGGFWPIEEPDIQERVIPHNRFFTEVGSWRLSCGISISARLGGVLVFDFSGRANAIMSVNGGPSYFPSLIEATDVRVKLINAFSLCLHSSRVIGENFGSPPFKIDHQDLFHLSGDDVREGVGGNGLQKLPAMVAGGGYLRDFHRHGVIPESSFDLTCETLDFLVTHNYEKALDLASLLNESLTSYANHEFASSLITSWAICETLLQHRWNVYVNREGVTSARRKRLTGRDYTASIMSEVLELGGAITPETLISLDKARKARNSWMHSISQPDFKSAGECITLATSMLGETLGREIGTSLSLSATGF
ncbi:hypothetical protein [Streptomyces microflavus]|uniref:hypothetical protein n=1 Tax=Streptomyces microflavus TaxID=1919 RepID=UPI003829F871